MTNKRKVLLVNGEYYHVLNRTIASEEVFNSNREFKRVVELLNYYRFRQEISFSKFKILSHDDKSLYLRRIQIPQNLLIEVHAFAIMPDHYHLLIKQLNNDGIKIFISNFQNGFAKYYNARNERDGSLFKSPFRAKLIDSDEKFLHISRYIHLNPVTSYFLEFKDLGTYPYTSFPYYLGYKKDNLVNTDFIIRMFGKNEKYPK